MPSAANLHAALGMLDPERYQYLVVGFLKLRTESEQAELTRDDVTRLALFDWLAHLGFDASQQERVVAFLPEGAGDLKTVVVSDARYVSFKDGTKGNQVFYDLYANEMLPRLPQRAVTHFVCDIAGLLERVELRLGLLGLGEESPAPEAESLTEDSAHVADAREE